MTSHTHRSAPYRGKVVTVWRQARVDPHEPPDQVDQIEPVAQPGRPMIRSRYRPGTLHAQ